MPNSPTPERWDTETAAMPPSRLGRYELLRPLGRGALGCVYLARDPVIDREVALKVVDLAHGLDDERLEWTSDRFLREARVCGRLNHPHIVTVHDCGEADGYAYIAMEHLPGRPLSDHVQPHTLLPPSRVLELMAAAADALHYAHVQNVVHRDIKPANIMYDSASGSLKLTDFGIARWIDSSRTRTGVVLGTPSFLSPEQLEGNIVNGHTDLFALGVSLYQLLTGRLPFQGNSMTELMFVIANEPHAPLTAVRPELPSRFDLVIDTALAKSPAQRYSSGAVMAAALRAAARHA